MDAQLDLGEFPEGYEGRKTYVRVKDRAGIFASCYTYVGHDGRNYLRPNYGGDLSGVPNRSDTIKMPHIMRDIGEYTSPIDGAQITSRSQHRNHLKQHDVIEVGNERVGNRAALDAPRTRELGEAIKRRVEEVKAMPQAQYDAQVKEKVHAHAE